MSTSIEVSLLDILKEGPKRVLFETKTIVMPEEGEIKYYYFLGICYLKSSKLLVDQIK